MEGWMVIEWGVRWCSYVVRAGPVDGCVLGRALGCSHCFLQYSNVTVVSDRNTAVRMGHAQLSSCLASQKIQDK